MSERADRIEQESAFGKERARVSNSLKCLKIRFLLLKLLDFVNLYIQIHLNIIYGLDLLHNCVSDRQKYSERNVLIRILTEAEPCVTSL